MPTSDPFLPQLIAVVDTCLDTGDIGPLHTFLSAIPEGQSSPGDDWRQLTAHLTGIPAGQVPEALRHAVKRGMFTVGIASDDDFPSALLELLGSLRSLRRLEVPALNLLPQRIAAVDVLMKTGDAKPLQAFFLSIPDDYEPLVDEWRATASHITGIPSEKVSKNLSQAIKHALYAVASTVPDDGPDEKTGIFTVTTRSALVSLLRSRWS